MKFSDASQESPNLKEFRADVAKCNRIAVFIPRGMAPGDGTRVFSVIGLRPPIR
ncbi:MAG: hypothetical protein KGJ03_03320 [Betaproteobacteria bacterium]|nr:hypothetical protein [Betaproteobacteria bacterium]MDE1954728.1 hypothetical protein [Betaproteobacteria bacterium]